MFSGGKWPAIDNNVETAVVTTNLSGHVEFCSCPREWRVATFEQGYSDNERTENNCLQSVEVVKTLLERKIM